MLAGVATQKALDCVKAITDKELSLLCRQHQAELCRPEGFGEVAETVAIYQGEAVLIINGRPHVIGFDQEACKTTKKLNELIEALQKTGQTVEVLERGKFGQSSLLIVSENSRAGQLKKFYEKNGYEGVEVISSIEEMESKLNSGDLPDMVLIDDEIQDERDKADQCVNKLNGKAPYCRIRNKHRTQHPPEETRGRMGINWERLERLLESETTPEDGLLTTFLNLTAGPKHEPYCKALPLPADPDSNFVNYITYNLTARRRNPVMSIISDPDIPPGDGIIDAANSKLSQTNPFAIHWVGSGAGRNKTRNGASPSTTKLQQTAIIPGNQLNIDPKEFDPSVNIFGAKAPMPFGIAPMGVHRFATPRGEITTAILAAQAGIPFCISGVSSTHLEAVTQAYLRHGGDIEKLFFQLYLPSNPQLVEEFLATAEKCGIKNIILTIDCDKLGPRLAVFRESAQVPFSSAIGMDIYRNSDIVYQEVCKMRSDGVFTEQNLSKYFYRVFSSPKNQEIITTLIANNSQFNWTVKGIMTPEAAIAALEAGAKGLYITTHGDRQSSNGWAVIEAIPYVIAGIKNYYSQKAIEIPKDFFLATDGGVRGPDGILKYLQALTIGNPCIFIGSQALNAMTIDGGRGLGDLVMFNSAYFQDQMYQNGWNTIRDIQNARAKMKQFIN